MDWYRLGVLEPNMTDARVILVLNGGEAGRRGGPPLYKLYWYVPAQRIWFFSCFGLKMGTDILPIII